MGQASSLPRGMLGLSIPHECSHPNDAGAQILWECMESRCGRCCCQAGTKMPALRASPVVPLSVPAAVALGDTSIDQGHLSRPLHFGVATGPRLPKSRGRVGWTMSHKPCGEGWRDHLLPLCGCYFRLESAEGSNRTTGTSPHHRRWQRHGMC